MTTFIIITIVVLLFVVEVWGQEEEEEEGEEGGEVPTPRANVTSSFDLGLFAIAGALFTEKDSGLYLSLNSPVQYLNIILTNNSTEISIDGSELTIVFDGSNWTFFLFLFILQFPLLFYFIWLRYRVDVHHKEFYRSSFCSACAAKNPFGRYCFKCGELLIKH